MTVEIKIFGEDAGHALRELFGLTEGLSPRQTGQQTAAAPTIASAAGQHTNSLHGGSKLGADIAVNNTPQEEPAETAAEAPRERGKPSGGRSRRTKEEIAEDEAADAADAAAAAAAGAQNISTGEECKDPAEDVEQDKKDEAADAVNAPAAEATVEGLRSVMGEYAKVYGMQAVQADGAKIFVAALGTPTEGATWKVSTVPADKIGMAVTAWSEALVKNPFKNAVVGA